MFGYLQPYKPYLLIKDYEIYRGVYCSLCKRLGEDYGFFSRLALSYDCTFYSILAMGLNGKCENIVQKRCSCNPLKKCVYCECGSDELGMAGAITVIALYYKIEDNIKDSGLIKSILFRALKPVVKRWRNKAKVAYPEIENIIKSLNEGQCRVEKSENPIIDSCAEPTANMVKGLMCLLAKTETEKLILGEFGYFIGKWIYLIDAVDDYEKDIKRKNFNPFIISEKCRSIPDDERKLYMNGVLNHSLSRILSSYNLMEIKSFNAIIENLVDMGLAQMQQDIIFNKNAKDKSKGENVNE